VSLLRHIVDYDGPNYNERGPEGAIFGVENVNGTNYADRIIGDTRANVLSGNGGDDKLTGGLGGDTFDFGAMNFGNDTITDFMVGQDHLRIDHTIFGNFAAVQQHMQQVGDDVVITYDGNDSITLQNVQMANLHANDFLFV